MLYEVSFKKNNVCQCRLVDAMSPDMARAYFEETEPTATLYGVSEHDGMIKPGMPIDRVPDNWRPTTNEKPAEGIQAIMDRLTALKAESIAEADPFGQSPADREIKAIDNVLRIFGVEWHYTWDGSEKWIATLCDSN